MNVEKLLKESTWWYHDLEVKRLNLLIVRSALLRSSQRFDTIVALIGRQVTSHWKVDKGRFQIAIIVRKRKVLVRLKFSFHVLNGTNLYSFPFILSVFCFCFFIYFFNELSSWLILRLFTELNRVFDVSTVWIYEYEWIQIYFLKHLQLCWE